MQRLVNAGALVLGKTNLDQLATGLVGTRSPYGAVRNALHPELISGGSSSGSAAAVALGIADLAVGTDTAGSGRVPAALHGIVGIKATLGVIPTHGVVPACADYDAVTIFRNVCLDFRNNFLYCSRCIFSCCFCTFISSSCCCCCLYSSAFSSI